MVFLLSFGLQATAAAACKGFRVDKDTVTDLFAKAFKGHCEAWCWACDEPGRGNDCQCGYSSAQVLLEAVVSCAYDALTQLKKSGVNEKEFRKELDGFYKHLKSVFRIVPMKKKRRLADDKVPESYVQRIARRMAETAAAGQQEKS